MKIGFPWNFMSGLVQEWFGKHPGRQLIATGREVSTGSAASASATLHCWAEQLSNTFKSQTPNAQKMAMGLSHIRFLKISFVSVASVLIMNSFSYLYLGPFLKSKHRTNISTGLHGCLSLKIILSIWLIHQENKKYICTILVRLFL